MKRLFLLFVVILWGLSDVVATNIIFPIESMDTLFMNEKVVVVSEPKVATELLALFQKIAAAEKYYFDEEVEGHKGQHQVTYSILSHENNVVSFNRFEEHSSCGFNRWERVNYYTLLLKNDKLYILKPSYPKAIIPLLEKSLKRHLNAIANGDEDKMDFEEIFEDTEFNYQFYFKEGKCYACFYKPMAISIGVGDVPVPLSLDDFKAVPFSTRKIALYFQSNPRFVIENLFD